MTSRAAVLGSPIGHSLSPALHRAAYAALGLDWQYDAYDVSQEGFSEFVAGLGEGELGGEWRGLSLTMPLKDPALRWSRWLEPAAAKVGAVNTVVDPCGERRGYNTDIAGMCWALGRVGVSGATTAAILGAGATARSAIAACAHLGVLDIEVWARRPEAVLDLRVLGREFGVSVSFASTVDFGAFPLVISTLPPGVADGFAESGATGLGCLLDVAYDPWPSVLAQAWESGGGVLASGVDMLLGQAMEQVQLMTGLEPPAEDMEVALVTALAARPSVADQNST